MLAGRRIVLGVTGGIAAYKAVEVCRRLVDAGAHVMPVLTEGATALRRRARRSRARPPSRRTRRCGTTSDPIPHTRLGQTADSSWSRPATARLSATYAAGISDDLLTTMLLATRAPVVVCPAMHTEMWEHPAVQDNLRTLARRGVHVVAARGGPPGRRRRRRRAAGRAGDDRRRRRARARTEQDLAGPARARHRRAAPASRSIRCASSSTGRRASRATRSPRRPRSRGAKVTLVTTTDRPAAPGVEVVGWRPRPRWSRPCSPAATRCDVVVMAAAVADFRPGRRGRPQDQEGRRRARDRPRADRRHPGRASARASVPGQTIVGFAAETDDVVAQRRGQARAARALDLDRGERRVGARRRVRARHQRGRRSCRRRDRAAMWR